jgi:hypothetical protein
MPDRQRQSAPRDSPDPGTLRGPEGPTPPDGARVYGPTPRTSSPPERGAEAGSAVASEGPTLDFPQDPGPRSEPAPPEPSRSKSVDPFRGAGPPIAFLGLVGMWEEQESRVRPSLRLPADPTRVGKDPTETPPAIPLSDASIAPSSLDGIDPTPSLTARRNPRS